MPGAAVRAELADQGLAQEMVRADEVLATPFQPLHPVCGGRAVALAELHA